MNSVRKDPKRRVSFPVNRYPLAVGFGVLRGTSVGPAYCTRQGSSSVHFVTL